MVRQDKFQVGDKVRLASVGFYKEKALDMKKAREVRYEWLTADGIYTITDLTDIGDGNRAVGHTQLLKLAEDHHSSGSPNWSGAYWERV